MSKHLSVYELKTRNDQNDFMGALLSDADNGQVPIFLASIDGIVRDEGGDLGETVIAVSLGDPMDPAELREEINQYHRQYVSVCPHVLADIATVHKYEAPVESNEGEALCAVCAALGDDADIEMEITCKPCFDKKVGACCAECSHKDGY